MPSITITVIDNNNVTTTAKITGISAGAGIGVLAAWMATQTVSSNANPPVVTPKYANEAEVIKEISIDMMSNLSTNFPGSYRAADTAEIATKTADMLADRRALFATARTEK